MTLRPILRDSPKCLLLTAKELLDGIQIGKETRAKATTSQNTAGRSKKENSSLLLRFSQDICFLQGGKGLSLGQASRPKHCNGKKKTSPNTQNTRVSPSKQKLGRKNHLPAAAERFPDMMTKRSATAVTRVLSSVCNSDPPNLLAICRRRRTQETRREKQEERDTRTRGNSRLVCFVREHEDRKNTTSNWRVFCAGTGAGS